MRSEWAAGDRLMNATVVYLTDREAARILRKHRNTLVRWRKSGVKGVDGVVYRPPFLKVGGKMLIERSALMNFIGKVSGVPQPEPALAEVG